MSWRLSVKSSAAAVFAVLSVAIQSLPPLFYVPWGMRIDLVAVPWVVAWILFGLETAILSMLISTPFVGYIGLGGGWIGAIMKDMASIWMFLIPALFAFKLGRRSVIENLAIFTLVGAIAIIVRDVVTAFLNLYFAIPFFFGMSPQEVIEFFSNSELQSFLTRAMGLCGFIAYFTEITVWNTVQGIIDLYSSLLIAKIIKRYGVIKEI
ncbi:hypothetical protein DRN86_03780 [Candidatus Geothermarchaeota archaeon]|nr:MAG: hypothetical protein DRN86_03780 [Candidatus Geothermarchaeota archaeon]